MLNGHIFNMLNWRIFDMLNWHSFSRLNWNSSSRLNWHILNMLNWHIFSMLNWHVLSTELLTNLILQVCFMLWSCILESKLDLSRKKVYRRCLKLPYWFALYKLFVPLKIQMLCKFLNIVSVHRIVCWRFHG